MSDVAKQLQDAHTKIGQLEAQVAQLTQKAAEQTAHATTLTAKATKADQLEPVVSDTVALLKASGVAVKDGEGLKEIVGRLVDENKALLSYKAAREEADIAADVDVAFATYKDQKGLSDKDKPAMLSHRKAHIESFNALYPPLPPEQRYLLRTVTPPEPRATAEQVVSTAPQSMSYAALTADLQHRLKLSLVDAQAKASRIIAGKEAYPQPGAGQ